MSSPVDQVLADFVAGRTSAGELVRAVRAAHYGAGGSTEPAWRALVETIERSMPGAVELAGAPDSPGFALKPLGDRVPPAYEKELKEAAQAALAAWTDARAIQTAAPPSQPVVLDRPSEGLWARLVRRVRALFR